MCGAFFIPHIFGKYIEREFTIGFFNKAGFHPAERYIYIALSCETVISIALIFGIYTRYAALAAIAFLAVATVAVYRVSNGKWFWNLGGYEYLIFWMLACLVVAMQG
jgi:putative oxidoreductase